MLFSYFPEFSNFVPLFGLSSPQLSLIILCHKDQLKLVLLLENVHHCSSSVPIELSILRSLKGTRLNYKFYSIRSISYYYYYFLNIFIGVQLLYNGVLASALQQSESVIHIHMFPNLFPLASPSLPPSLSHPSRWSQSTELISLCYAAASH